MAPSPLVAGIDLATANVRVAVAAGDGRVVARAEAPLAPPHRPAPGVSEQDAGSWWPAVTRNLVAEARMNDVSWLEIADLFVTSERNVKARFGDLHDYGDTDD